MQYAALWSDYTSLCLGCSREVPFFPSIVEEERKKLNFSRKLGKVLNSRRWGVVCASTDRHTMHHILRGRKETGLIYV